MAVMMGKLYAALREANAGKLVRHLERDPTHQGALGPRHQESWLDSPVKLGNE